MYKGIFSPNSTQCWLSLYIGWFYKKHILSHVDLCFFRCYQRRIFCIWLSALFNSSFLVLVPCEVLQPFWLHDIYQYPFVCFYITSYFGRILDLHKSCKDTLQRVHVYLYSPFLNMNIPQNHNTVIQTKNIGTVNTTN